MYDVGGILNGALERSRDDLERSAAQTSRSQTPLGNTRSDAAMAAAARSALFTEALLSAVHARLAEIKSVTHG